MANLHEATKIIPAHIPVMPEQVLAALGCACDVSGALAPRLYLDMTFGGGGHSRAILDASQSNRILAIDRDESVHSIACALHREYGERFMFRNVKFSDVDTIVCAMQVCEFDGILFDLGTSSMQLECPDRGFSFMHDSRLDMRMSLNNMIIDAEYVVNNFTEQELSRIILGYGDERHAKRIAHAICCHRLSKRIVSTHQLADIISKSVEGYNKRAKIHPATKTFQAIRIAVNDELTEVEYGLTKVLDMLAVGGTLVVISFHSLEDSIVKRIFKCVTKRTRFNKYAQYQRTVEPLPCGLCCETHRTTCDAMSYGMTNHTRHPSSQCNGTEHTVCAQSSSVCVAGRAKYGCVVPSVGKVFRDIYGGTIQASRSEVLQNRRARSAKMRALRRIV